jgi:bifunctional polynucleotide phosphatase/kinase
MNLNIPFYTPEEYFLGDKPGKYVLGAFNPMDYIPVTESISTTVVEGLSAESAQLLGNVISPPTKLEVLLFVGSPASGKSTFYQEHLMPLGYARVNQDTLKTRERCVEEASALLENNLSIAIGYSI